VRVVYLLPSLDGSGGAEQAVAALAGPLRARGVDLTVLVFAGRGAQGRASLTPVVESAGAVVGELSAASTAGRMRELARELRRSRPDLLHTTLFDADVVGRVTGRLVGTPVVSSLVNVAYGPEQKANPALTPWKVDAARWVERLTAVPVRRFHALTPYVASVMGPRLGIPADRIDVIPRGRDPEQLGAASPQRRDRVRRGLGIDDDRPVVVAAARHEYQKGLDVLVAAWPKVRAAHPTATLLIGGRDGNESARLTAQVARVACGGIEQVGPRDDVPDLLVAADVFVVPSRWEGFGSILVEAMALGSNLVATDVEPIPDVVGPDWARLVGPERPDELAAAIVAALDQPADERARRQAAARRRFDGEFHIDVVADRTLAFYERALG
jgi:glycosyltransferase involved in cell wall biosynthesis